MQAASQSTRLQLLTREARGVFFRVDRTMGAVLYLFFCDPTRQVKRQICARYAPAESPDPDDGKPATVWCALVRLESRRSKVVDFYKSKTSAAIHSRETGGVRTWRQVRQHGRLQWVGRLQSQSGDLGGLRIILPVVVGLDYRSTTVE